MCSCVDLGRGWQLGYQGAFAALGLCSPICLLPPGLGLFPSHEGKEMPSYRLGTPPSPATFSAGTFLALGWGWGALELGHSFPPSQEPVGSIKAFLAQPSHQAGTTRCFLEGGACWIHARVAPPDSGLALGRGCLCVYVWGVFASGYVGVGPKL